MTGIGGDVGTAIARCLCDGLNDIELYGVDIKALVPMYHQLKKYYVVPQYTEPTYWSAIEQILLTEKITDFWPTTEPEILIMNQYRSFFDEHKIHLIINNEMILNIATSKKKTALFLRKYGFNTPSIYSYDEITNNQFPLIVKPDHGCGSVGVCVVHSKEELDLAMKNMPLAVIQEYIGSDKEEYTIGVFSDGENSCAIIFRRTLGFGGMSVYVETIQNKEMEKIAIDCAHCFDLQGAFNIQLRKHKGFYYIFEINPRISSTVHFRHLMGFQDAVWWLKFQHHELNYPFAPLIPSGLIGIKSFTECVIQPPFDKRFFLN